MLCSSYSGIIHSHQITWIWSIKSHNENLVNKKNCTPDSGCIMVELLLLLPSARCILTVSSQIESLKLRVCWTPSSIVMRRFSPTQISDDLDCDKTVWTEMQFWKNDALPYCESHKVIFQGMHSKSFYKKEFNAQGFLGYYSCPSFFQLFRFTVCGATVIIIGVLVSLPLW